MAVEHGIASALSMTDKVWARHANPWSFWTRLTTLPLLVAAIWSRQWIGWWSLLPIAIAIVWIWLNPRVFPPPKSTDNWASKAVLGERVWLNRRNIPVPDHHRIAPNILIALSAMGIPPLIWGLVHLQPWPTVLGVAVIYLAKLWFVDRMAWLYEDMKTASPEYQSWLY